MTISSVKSPSAAKETEGSMPFHALPFVTIDLAMQHKEAQQYNPFESNGSYPANTSDNEENTCLDDMLPHCALPCHQDPFDQDENVFPEINYTEMNCSEGTCFPDNTVTLESDGRIDLSAPLSATQTPSLTAHSPVAQQSTENQPKDDSGSKTLSNTCPPLFNKPSSVKESSHTNIQHLSKLLKLRMLQAKYRLLASLEAGDRSHEDNALYQLLSTDPYFCLSGVRKKRSVMQRSLKKHQMDLVTVGNKRNLFKGGKRQRNQSPSSIQKQDTLPSTTAPMSDALQGTGHIAPNTPQSGILQKEKKYKHQRNVEKTPQPKSKRTNADRTTDRQLQPSKRRRPNCDITPVVLEDGSRVFKCMACDKKYKNKNGLVYHLDRCKNLINRSRPNARIHDSSGINEQTVSQAGSPTNNNSINNSSANNSSLNNSPSNSYLDNYNQTDDDEATACVCDNASEDGLMVQCDFCHYWLHTNCVDFWDTMDIFQCPYCAVELSRYPSISTRSGIPSMYLH